MKSKYVVVAGGDNNAEPLRYVFYAQKSSKDVGAQVKSLPDQIKDCLNFKIRTAMHDKKIRLTESIYEPRN